MSFNKAYIVIGNTGEYDDYRNWNVRVFIDKDKAKAFLKTCVTWANKYATGEIYDSLGYEDRMEYFKHNNCPDPDIQLDYTGTHYTIDEVDADLT